MPEFVVREEESREPWRDPAVAVLVTFDDYGNISSRTMRLLTELGDVSTSEELFARIERQLEQSASEARANGGS